MTLDLALRITEILLGFAFMQQSLEYLYREKETRILFAIRLGLSLFLAFGLWSHWICALLCLNSFFILKRFQGPYNGGSDRMGNLVLFCVFLAHWLPAQEYKELAFGYLALQLTLSYFISGWVKIVNPEWRSGKALIDVFVFSAYPASEQLRNWAHKSFTLTAMSWAVMLFELIFPLLLLTQISLIAGLVIAASFHLANACLFGLNRFFWTWLTAYPSILFLQQRLLNADIIML